MNNATEIEWDIDNEKVSISFKNEDINNSLKDYALDYRCKDINIENESSDSEATLTRLMLINNSLKYLLTIYFLCNFLQQHIF